MVNQNLLNVAILETQLIERTYEPMNDTLKETLFETFSMVGTISSLRQSRASGHLDMMYASRGIFGAICSGDQGWSALP